jgi:hypothetical protein
MNYKIRTTEISRRIIGSIALVLPCGLSLQAQASTATLSGFITDPNGLPVPGANLASREDSTAIETTTSDTAGENLVSTLSPGTYNFAVTQTGFKSEERMAIVLHVNGATSLDFQLQVGSVVEKVNVSAQSALLQTLTAEVGTAVDECKAEDLPATT